MSPIYVGKGRRPEAAPQFPSASVRPKDDPAGYVADDDLARAVNLAILLGRPLVVTGEPGTGKTQLAHSVAWELGCGDVIEFVTKSTSEARDLFYSFDSVAYFHARGNDGRPADPRRFLTYRGLGEAILRSLSYEQVKDHLPRTGEDRPPPPGSHAGPRRSVVLIDEIDKAPRDFPNDVLSEIERLRFSVPEASLPRIEAGAARPIVIITSNSERDLPAPFLRRCVFHWIRHPDEDDLREIVARRLDPRTPVELVHWPVDLLLRLRNEAAAMEKKPTTSELLDWAALLCREAGATDPEAFREAALSSVGVVAKSQADRERATAAIRAWRPPQTARD